MKNRFQALRVVETGKGGETFSRHIEERSIDDLPEDEVLIRVHYSSLNYKDALSASGHRGITRSYPHTPGIDAAGVVENSDSSQWRKGDKVIVTSYDLGMDTDGGFGQYIRVPADWIVPLPGGLSLRESMMLGTAGFTAGLSFYRLQQVDVTADSHPALVVTGASGGVGSLSISLGAVLNYSVTAITGKQERKDYLQALGAEQILSRTALEDENGGPLLSRRWDAGIDSVGGTMLSTLLKSIQQDGAVASCGNVGGNRFEATIYPFILRGIALLGIDSGNCPMPRRRTIWKRLAREHKLGADRLERITTEIQLQELPDYIFRMLEGKTTGRILVNLQE